jgi:glutamyl-tRNA reductase
LSAFTNEIRASGALDALRVVSLSHRTCGLPALGGVVAHGDGARLHASLTTAGVASIVLSTCNRFEVYWRSTNLAADDDRVAETLASTLPLTKDLFDRGSILLAGDDAAMHLFRVCSGLESIVLGEAEILGQVRAAMEQSTGAGSFLRGVFTSAIRTGRGARAATGIAAGAMSVASAAIQQLTSQVRLSESRVLVIGAGETAAKVVRQVAKIGVGKLVIANRTLDRAQALADTYRGSGVGLDALPEEIAAADVIICASHADGWLVTRAQVADRGPASRLAIVDLSMPPAVEPFEIEGVTRIDLPAIERATAQHRQRRETEIPRVDAYIADELAWLQVWARQEMLRPFVSTLRQKVDGIRRDELERARQELAAGDPHAVLERLSRRMFDRFLAVPVDQLKNGDVPFDGRSADYLRRLFALDDESVSGPSKGEREPALRDSASRVES